MHATKGLEISQAKKIFRKFNKKDLIGMNISQIFSDPYGKKVKYSKSLINSWTDSGINALSVIGELLGENIKKLKLNIKSSKLDTNNVTTALFNISSLQINYSVSTSWNLGIDLKVTQIYLPKLDLRVTLDHSKQQLYYGFSTQLIHKKAVKKYQNRLKAHYYEVLVEAIIKCDTSKARKNMELISEQFYSVINNLK